MRGYVDGVLKHDFGPLADEMKDGMNQWEDLTLDLTKTQLFQTISAFGAAMSAIGDAFTPYVQTMQRRPRSCSTGDPSSETGYAIHEVASEDAAVGGL